MFVRAWVASAAVAVFVAAPSSPQEGAADTALSEYRQLLAHLDTATPACLDTAREALSKRFGGGHPDGEAAVRAFRDFYLARFHEWEKVMGGPEVLEFTFRHWLGPEDHNPLVPFSIRRIRDVPDKNESAAIHRNPTLPSQLEAVRAWPFSIKQGEGDWYLCPDFDWLAAAARPVASGLSEFLGFAAREARERVVEDGGLQIPWDDLRLRIVRWDAFARSHPTLPEVAKEVRPDLGRLFTAYLCPLLPNTTEYDRDTGVLDPSLQASYRRFVAENHDATGHAFLEGLLSLLKTEKYRLTPAVEAYLNRQDSPAPCGIRRR